MINSFKNNYKSARKAFEIKEQVSLKSLSKFERKYLPSKLISNYVPFTLTSTV
jgi:predicted RNA-binding protein Jag